MKLALGFCSLLLIVSGAFAQNNSPMSLSTEEHGPGDRLTLFITFKEPMVVASLSCTFGRSSAPKPEQSLFLENLNCEGIQKDSDTEYRTFITIPENTMSGEYTLRGIGVGIGGVSKTYQGADLPSLPSFKVRDPKQNPKFAPIKDVTIRKAQ
jgi:hypothetical protein